jgi:hypothetical protein
MGITAIEGRADGGFWILDCGYNYRESWILKEVSFIKFSFKIRHSQSSISNRQSYLCGMMATP